MKLIKFILFLWNKYKVEILGVFLGALIFLMAMTMLSQFAFVIFLIILFFLLTNKIIAVTIVALIILFFVIEWKDFKKNETLF